VIGDGVHTIRLSGFWIPDDSDPPQSFSRSFGKPRVQTADDTYWLVTTTDVRGVILNDEILAFQIVDDRLIAALTNLKVRNRIQLLTKQVPTASIEIRSPQHE
jgi:hypothetical protein